MDIPKLQIIRKFYCGESTVISMRIPKDMLEDLDKLLSLLARQEMKF